MSYDNLFWGGLDKAGINVPNHSQWKIQAEKLLADRDIFHPTTTKKFPLGALAEARDGRRWRYCENGASVLVLALVNQHSAGIAGWQAIVQTNSPDTASIGDKFITATVTTTAVAGDFIDGYLTIEDGTGQGAMYLVKDNKTGTTNDTSGFDVVCEIADTGGVRIATGTATDITLTKNKNKDVIVESGTGFVVGVNHTAVAANSFFWAQTRGVCPIASASTVGVIGDAVMSNGSGSAIILGNAATDFIIGHVVRAAANTEYALIDLSIE